jgi:hypothetical protein
MRSEPLPQDANRARGFSERKVQLCQLAEMLFPKEKAVRSFGVSISGFFVGQTVRDERTALAI